MKFAVRERIEKGYPNEPLLAATQSRGVVEKGEYENRTVTATKDLHLLKLVRVDDFVISLRSFQGGIEISHAQGIISPAYTILAPGTRVAPQYLKYYFKSAPFISSLGLFVTGIREGQNIDYTRLSRATLPVPPRDEQAAIVRYLDWACGRLDRAIQAKRKIIALLSEQKQAIIDRVVTRGLDPSAGLKPSGVELLGVVPRHWRVLRLARVIKHGPQNGVSPAITDNGTIKSFSISAIRNGRVDIRERDKKYVSGGANLLDGSYQLLKGDILIVRGNGNIRLVGRAGLVTADLRDWIYPDLLMRVRIGERILPKFLVVLLNSTLRAQTESAARTAVGTFKINNQQVRQLWIPLPDLSEQKSLLRFLSHELESPNAAEARVLRSIALLSEFRTRLIADVVTGKLDVRKAASKLPAEESRDADAEALDENTEELAEELTEAAN